MAFSDRLAAMKSKQETGDQKKKEEAEKTSERAAVEAKEAKKGELRKEYDRVNAELKKTTKLLLEAEAAVKEANDFAVQQGEQLDPEARAEIDAIKADETAASVKHSELAHALEQMYESLYELEPAAAVAALQSAVETEAAVVESLPAEAAEDEILPEAEIMRQQNQTIDVDAKHEEAEKSPEQIRREQFQRMYDHIQELAGDVANEYNTAYQTVMKTRKLNRALEAGDRLDPKDRSYGEALMEIGKFEASVKSHQIMVETLKGMDPDFDSLDLDRSVEFHQKQLKEIKKLQQGKYTEGSLAEASKNVRTTETETSSVVKEPTEEAYAQKAMFLHEVDMSLGKIEGQLNEDRDPVEAVAEFATSVSNIEGDLAAEAQTEAMETFGSRLLDDVKNRVEEKRHEATENGKPFSSIDQPTFRSLGELAGTDALAESDMFGSYAAYMLEELAKDFKGVKPELIRSKLLDRSRPIRQFLDPIYSKLARGETLSSELSAALKEVLPVLEANDSVTDSLQNYSKEEIAAQRLTQGGFDQLNQSGRFLTDSFILTSVDNRKTEEFKKKGLLGADGRLDEKEYVKRVKEALKTLE